MKEIFKRQNAITLIALIITIVILIILAAVSIAMLTGENGLLTQASKGKNKMAFKGLKEEVSLMLEKRRIDEVTGTKLELKDDLEKEISGNKIIEEIEGITDAYYVTKDNQTVTVYEDGMVVDGKNIWDGISKSKPTVDSEGNWHIKTVDEFKYFADFVNGKLNEEEKAGLNIGKTTIIYLENHLDLGARQKDGIKTRGINWTPIGKSSKFVGIFEGNNHVIRGIYEDEEGNLAGVFGDAHEIKNLTIKDSYVNGGNWIGSLVGVCDVLENCYNENTEVVSKEGNYHTIGGLVGQINERIENCTNTGTVIANGKKTDNGYSYCGGIVGQCNSSNNVAVQNCTNRGKITSSGAIVGGITAFAGIDAKIIECTNVGTITGKSNYVGGIAGSSSGTIERCENQGKVAGEGERIGGIAANSATNAVIEECKNSGEVLGESNFVGGIAGSSSGTIERCENQGKVAGEGERIGGIAGESGLHSLIKECKNRGEIKGKSQNVGGIAGIGFHDIENSYNSGHVIGEKSVGGILGQIGIDGKTNIINCGNEGIVEGLGPDNVEEPVAVGGIIGWTSTTGTSGKIENNYNKGRIIGNAKNKGIGGIVGRNSNSFQVSNCYNKGIIEGKDGVGSIIGFQTENNNNNLNHLYYLNTIGIKAISNTDDPSRNIVGVSDNIDNYEQFIQWIETKQ